MISLGNRSTHFPFRSRFATAAIFLRDTRSPPPTTECTWPTMRARRVHRVRRGLPGRALPRRNPVDFRRKKSVKYPKIVYFQTKTSISTALSRSFSYVNDSRRPNRSAVAMVRETLTHFECAKLKNSRPFHYSKYSGT